MNIYIDVDGVLLANEHYPAVYMEEFLEFVTANHDCYWLTTHCKGDRATVYRVLEGVIPESAWQYVKRIKPTTWNTWKTEAIDFSQDFRWFDDYVFAEEKEVLKENNALDKWVEVDLASTPDMLEDITNEMKLPVFECKECGEECEWCRYREDAVGSHMNEAKDSIIDPVDDKEVTLQKFAHSTCKGSVLARIDEGGNIIINDWSMGSYTEKYLGHDDAEADVSIPPSSKDKLITCLLEETFKQDDSRNFSGGYDFHNWLDEKSIDHKFSSWP